MKGWAQDDLGQGLRPPRGTGRVSREIGFKRTRHRALAASGRGGDGAASGWVTVVNTRPCTGPKVTRSPRYPEVPLPARGSQARFLLPSCFASAEKR